MCIRFTVGVDSLLKGVLIEDLIAKFPTHVSQSALISFPLQCFVLFNNNISCQKTDQLMFERFCCVYLVKIRRFWIMFTSQCRYIYLDLNDMTHCRVGVIIYIFQSRNGHHHRIMFRCLYEYDISHVSIFSFFNTHF